MEALKIGGSWLITIVVGVISFGAVAAVFLNRSQTSKFVVEVKGELVKCSWPWDPSESGMKKYRELIDSTTVVALTTLVLAAYTSGFDFLISRVVGWLVRF
jgi:preprotein translocase subunit SecE